MAGKGLRSIGINKIIPEQIDFAKIVSGSAAGPGSFVAISSDGTPVLVSLSSYIATGGGDGDITGVTAGDGLSGGGDTGAVTLAVSVDDTTIETNSDTIRAKTAAIANGGTGLATADQIHTFVTTQTDAIDADTAGNAATATKLAAAVNISGVAFDGSQAITLNNNAITNGAGYTTNTGDITGVTAGDGLTGGGDTGAVTLNVGSGTGINVNANDIEVDADGATLTTSNSDVDHILINDGGVFKRITKGNINVGDFNNDAGYTTNTGDITGVTAGNGLTGGGDSGGVSLAVDLSQLSMGTGLDSTGGGTGLALDLSEFTDMTENIDRTQDELILLDNGSERKKLISEIPLTAFDNDHHYVSVTLTGDTDASGTDALFDPFDENNSTSFSSTTHTSNGISYASNTGRFTFNRTGIYVINAVVYIEQNGAATLGRLGIALNATSYVVDAAGVYVHGSVDPVERTISIIRSFNDTDFIQLLVQPGTGRTATIHNGTTMNIFQIA